MRAVVESDTCIGCNLCSQICPEVFAFEGEKAVVVANQIPAEYFESAKEAAEKCPVDAISIE